MEDITSPSFLKSPRKGLNPMQDYKLLDDSLKANPNFYRSHKEVVRKVKKNKLSMKRIAQLIACPTSKENDKPDLGYYSQVQSNTRNQSTASLYASTPDNKNELKPDDMMAGEDAIHNMHSKFRKYRRIKEKEKLEGSDPKYPLVEFINATDKRKVLPKTTGLVNKNPSVEKYPLESVKSAFVGKDYAVPFSEGIQVINKLKDLDLSSSDLSNGMLIPILEKLPNSLENLDISSNRNFSSAVYQTLASLISDKERNIKSLCLDNTNMNDQNLEILQEALVYARNLETLDISRNEITDSGAIILGDIILTNISLKTLLVHWNRLMYKGGKIIANSLQGNTVLETFDISFNNIGGGFDHNKCAEAFKDCFKDNTSLIHSDISFCGLNQEEIIIINEGLSENHTIWGIH